MERIKRLNDDDDKSSLTSLFVSFLSRNAFWNGLALRLFLAWFLPWLLDGGRGGVLPGVKYTDIDFYVFTDAADYITAGGSPYDRHTYRYTPFLAELLSYMPKKQIGRYLFCIADSICGYIICQYRLSTRSIRRSKKKNISTKMLQEEEGGEEKEGGKDDEEEKEQCVSQLQDALWWQYNPLAINICTRGSSESLMVLLPVLLTIQIVTTGSSNPKTTKGISWISRSFFAGICHGIAIHSKLYPIIYTLSYMVYFVTHNNNNIINNNNNKNTRKSKSFPWLQPKHLFRLVKLWIVRLLTPIPLLFLVTSLSTFGFLTWLGVQRYGITALDDGLLYHFSRVDHRHNYSMYWYWIYLAMARTGGTNLKLIGRILLLPQILLLLYSSLGIACHNLGLAMFVQTFLFVTHNKVITAQYFTWYLCLLPLCSDSLDLNHRRVKVGLTYLGLSIIFWLGSAYCLEMQGMAVHRIVWVASVIYFFANVNLMGALLKSYNKMSTTTEDSIDKKQR